jgi:acyl dehydratase
VTLEPLPDYVVKARNTSSNSENKIHDDATARRYGFRGALVPGVTVYAYLTQPLVAAFGAAWLERGAATVRFHKPVMDGEEVRVAGRVTARDASRVTATVTGATAAESEAATLAATLPAGLPTPVNLAMYRQLPLPDPRPDATRAHLQGLDALGTPVNCYDETAAAEWLERVGDPLPFYHGRTAWVHPAFFLDQANRALRQNVRLGPWIHAGSVVRHLGGARVGETLATRGRVRSLFEEKGREFVELDLVVVAGDRSRPVAHILHTAIYQLGGPEMAHPSDTPAGVSDPPEMGRTTSSSTSPSGSISTSGLPTLP